MTLQQLEYVVALHRFRHFANAAQHCHVTQPTLSAVIQKLEEELGTQLFDREKRPIETTKAGEQVVKLAAKVLIQAANIKNAISEMRHSLCGELRIGMLPTITPYLVPRMIPIMEERLPQLRLKIVELKVDDVCRAISSGDIDVGIVAELPSIEKFTKSLLYYEEFLAYVPQNSPLIEKNVIRTADLATIKLYLLDEGHCFHNQMRRFCHLPSAGESLRTYQIGSLETFMRLVECGCGATIIPELAVRQLDKNQQKLVKQFAIPHPVRKIVAITGNDFIRNAQLNALVDCIRSAVPRQMLTITPPQILV